MARVLASAVATSASSCVVVYLSGAHAYGFPSPDSDLDLKAIHVAKTADLLGFELPAPTVDRAEIIDGVEIDYTSNELAHALAGVLSGNGNFLERVLGRMVPHASPLLVELRPIVQRSLSHALTIRRCRRVRLEIASPTRAEVSTAKKLLYVLRTTLTGIHLLETGELEPDLTRVMGHYGLSDAAALVERAGGGIAEPGAARPLAARSVAPRVDRLFARLDEARERSALPEEPANESEVKEWLLAVRRCTVCVAVLVASVLDSGAARLGVHDLNSAGRSETRRDSRRYRDHAAIGALQPAPSARDGDHAAIRALKTASSRRYRHHTTVGPFAAPRPGRYRDHVTVGAFAALPPIRNRHLDSIRPAPFPRHLPPVTHAPASSRSAATNARRDRPAPRHQQQPRQVGSARTRGDLRLRWRDDRLDGRR